jgi:hypothetical protein
MKTTQQTETLSRRSTVRLLSRVVFATALGLCGPAGAETFVGASASGGGGSSASAGTDSTASGDNTIYAYARAFDDENTSSSHDGAGPGSLCTFGLSCPLTGLSVQGLIGLGYAAAQASGDSGALKAYAHTLDSGYASAFARITDSITFLTGDRTLDITIHIPTLEATGTDGYADLGFGLALPPDPSNPDAQEQIIAAFNVFDGETSGYEFYKQTSLLGGLTLVDSGSNTPGSYSFQFDFDDICQFMDTNFCPDTIEIIAGLSVEAGGNATVKADESVYLAVTSPHISLNGYQYLGPTAVPVPPAVWLFGSGLLGLIGVARRKRVSVAA